MTVLAFGSDIGGILIPHRLKHRPRTPDDLNRAPFPGAFEALHQLRHCFGDRIFIISRVNDEAGQARTLQWLQLHNFTARTSIPLDRVHFCWDYPDKAPIAARLGLTHFVDDRLKVLRWMVDSVPHRYLMGADPDEVNQIPEYLPHVQVMQSWAEILSVFGLNH